MTLNSKAIESAIGSGPLPTYRTKPSPSRYSDGRAVGAILAGKLRRPPTRWQDYVLRVSLERLDGPGSPLAYPLVIIIVGRRCGKSSTLFGVPLARALDGPITLDNGKRVPFTGSHMAQNLVKAAERFNKDLVQPLEHSMTATMWKAGYHQSSALGNTYLRLDPATRGKDWHSLNASTINVVAPTISSVRGDGLAHITIDEFLVFSAVQGELMMSAAAPTAADLRGHAQMVLTSNISTLSGPRSWMRVMRERGRAAVAADARQGIAYFEYTIPDDADPLDESVWWDYYPALGDGLVRPEELRSELETGRMSPEAFAAEFFGRWPGESTITAWQAITRMDWEAISAADIAELTPNESTAIGVDLDPYGRSASISAARLGPDADTIEVELVDHRPGTAWVADAVRQFRTAPAIGIDDYGPGHDLIFALSDSPEISERIIATKSIDFSAACYVLDARIRERRLAWRSSTLYDTATASVSAAQRTSGKAWQWERRVGLSQTPLVSATLAAHALTRRIELPEPEIF
jgi:hypothetical protein